MHDNLNDVIYLPRMTSRQCSLDGCNISCMVPKLGQSLWLSGKNKDSQILGRHSLIRQFFLPYIAMLANTPLLHDGIENPLMLRQPPPPAQHLKNLKISKCTPSHPRHTFQNCFYSPAATLATPFVILNTTNNQLVSRLPINTSTDIEKDQTRSALLQTKKQQQRQTTTNPSSSVVHFPLPATGGAVRW